MLVVIGVTYFFGLNIPIVESGLQRTQRSFVELINDFWTPDLETIRDIETRAITTHLLLYCPSSPMYRAAPSV